MELYYYGLSDPGLIRDNNEDFFFAGKLKEDEYLFIVADGMGGHQAGEVASQKAVSMFVKEMMQENKPAALENPREILGYLEDIVVDINETLMEEGSKFHKKNGMGTTLSVLYIKNRVGYIVHVGDSRVYLYGDAVSTGRVSPLSPPRPGEPGHPVEQGEPKRLHQLTEDHSFVGKLVKDGFITEEEARNHPKRNVLYQSIGLKRDITIQTLGGLPILKGQKYLLCSDGLYGVVPEEEMEGFLSGGSVSQIAEQLIKRANFNGGPDNISAIVVVLENDEANELSDTAKARELADTVKIVGSSARAKRKVGVWVLALLGLLVLLLILVIYFLLASAVSDSNPMSPLAKKEIILK